MLIAVVGDCLLDVVARPSGPVRAGGDTPARVRVGPGGQGANVAVRLARRGASVRLVAPMADDAGARLLRDVLSREAVDLAPLGARRTGFVVALLDEGGDRTMLSDRVTPDATELAGLLDGAGWVHCSGYVLRDDAGAQELLDALVARPRGTRLSVAGGSTPPDPSLAATFLNRVRAAGCDLLITSRDEAAALTGGADDALPLVRQLAERLPSCLVLVTAGSDGSAAAGPGIAPFSVPAPQLPGTPVDSTGAGDAFTAALIDELAHLGTWPPPMPELERAMAAASRLGAQVTRVEGAQGPVSGETSPRLSDEQQRSPERG